MQRMIVVIAAGIAVAIAAAGQGTQGNEGIGGYGSPHNLTRPAPPSPPLKPLHTEPLGKLNNPTDTLSNASVEDNKGQSVGRVQSVNTTKWGDVRSIYVQLTNNTAAAGKVVSLKANELVYVPASNLLHASLPIRRIDALPAVKPKTFQQQAAPQ